MNNIFNTSFKATNIKQLLLNDIEKLKKYKIDNEKYYLVNRYIDLIIKEHNKKIESELDKFGYKKIEICPICKNEKTDVIIDKAILNQYNSFYIKHRFKAFKCHCCGYSFSVWYE